MSKYKIAREFTLPRSSWWRGNPNDSGLLLSREVSGRVDFWKCCIGHYSLACGFTLNELRTNDYLENIVDEAFDEGRISLELYHDFKEIADKLWEEQVYLTNDLESLNDEQREKLITEKLARIGITVNIV